MEMEGASEQPAASAELNRFREEWLSEVARNRRPRGAFNVEEAQKKLQRRREAAASQPQGGQSASRKDDYSEEVEPRTYHDLPDQENALKLGADGERIDRVIKQEPSSALEHYEHAVEKETQGQLGDSIRHYRKAFKVRSLTTLCSTYAEVSCSSMTVCTKPIRRNISRLPLSSRNLRTPTLPMLLLPCLVLVITRCMVVRVQYLRHYNNCSMSFLNSESSLRLQQLASHHKSDACLLNYPRRS